MQCTAGLTPQDDVSSHHDHAYPTFAEYSASVTFSIQVTGEPLSFSWTAMCVMAVVGVAPCQCFSPGGNHTTSPGRISSIGPPPSDDQAGSIELDSAARN